MVTAGARPRSHSRRETHNGWGHSDKYQDRESLDTISLNLKRDKQILTKCESKVQDQPSLKSLRVKSKMGKRILDSVLSLKAQSIPNSEFTGLPLTTERLVSTCNV